MININVDVDRKQLDALLKKVSPEMVINTTQEILKEAVDEGHHAALHNIKGGTQQAGHSMRAEVKPMMARVYSVMPPARALSIEEGRKPGEVVPYMQAVRHTAGRYLTRQKLDRYLRDTGKYYLTTEEHRAVRKMQESIRVTGTKPKHFIAGAVAVVKRELPSILDRAALRIERRLSGK